MEQKISLYTPLLDELYTVYQRDMCVNALQKAIDSEYDIVKNSLSELQSLLPFTLVDAIIDIAQKQNIDLAQKGAAQTFYQDMIHVLNKLPTLELALAFTPTYQQLKIITGWWRDQTNSYVLLDIKVDKNLLAGAIIGYDGNMQDFTLNKYLNTSLAQSKGEDKVQSSKFKV